MAENFFVTTYGEPGSWVCPDCGIRFTIYPGLPFDRENHNCAKSRIKPKACRCWWVLKDDHRVESFVVDGLPFPDEMSVETLDPDGKPEFWDCREEGGNTVFYPPKHYKDAEFYRAELSVERGALMRPGPRQTLDLVDRPSQERLALKNRKTVDLWLKEAASRGG